MSKILKHLWSVACTSSSIDSEDNNISLYKVIEQLNVTMNAKNVIGQSGPIVAGVSLELVTLWKKNIKGILVEGQQKSEWVDPEGKVLQESINFFKMPKPVGRSRFKSVIKGLKLTMPGDYIFRISAKANEENEFQIMTELPIQVEISRE